MRSCAQLHSGQQGGTGGWQHAHNTPCRRAPIAQAKSRKQPVREIVVGIDLGTTNSAVAYVENGKPRCIPNADGDKITPSVVTFLPDGDAVVGKQARRLAATHPDTTFYSVKRLIGRPFTDPVVEEEMARLAFKVGEDAQGQVTLQCNTVTRGFIYPEEVSAQVLAQLLDDAEAFTGAEVRKAVVSVPAYFTNKQREATTNAGQLAGLDVVRIIREPVAAALAYGLNLQEDQTVLVLDLGGGTYDISLLEVGNGTIEVLSTGGDAHLGGDDWDNLIMEWVVSKASTPLDTSNPRMRANLRALAEAAKHGLTLETEVKLRLPVGGPRGGPLELTLSRAQFEVMSQQLWQRARLPLDQACWAAGVDLNSIITALDEKKAELGRRGVPSWKMETMQPEIRPKARAPLSKVLLVGGASRMPSVISFIQNMTGQTPEVGALNLDEAVALGAAVQAGILQGEVSNLMVMDQWQASLMRALAKAQLKQDKSARAVVEEKFSLAEEDSGEPEAAPGTGPDPSDQEVEAELETQAETEQEEGEDEEDESIQKAAPVRRALTRRGVVKAPSKRRMRRSVEASSD